MKMVGGCQWEAVGGNSGRSGGVAKFSSEPLAAPDRLEAVNGPSEDYFTAAAMEVWACLV